MPETLSSFSASWLLRKRPALALPLGHSSKVTPRFEESLVTETPSPLRQGDSTSNLTACRPDTPPEFQRNRMARLHGPGVLESPVGKLLAMTFGGKAADGPCGTGRPEAQAFILDGVGTLDVDFGQRRMSRRTCRGKLRGTEKSLPFVKHLCARFRAGCLHMQEVSTCFMELATLTLRVGPPHVFT